MGDFSITKTESGWTVIKDGATYTVTDTNNNGRYDSTDKIIFGDQSANPLSAEDRAEIKFSIMKADPEGMTDAEMAQYDKFVQTKEQQQKAEEEQARLQEEREAALWAASQPRKKSFWEKCATVLGFAMPALTGIGAGLVAAGSNSWQYNNCDSGLKWMTGISGGLMGFTASLTSMMPFLMGSKNQSMMSSLNFNSLLSQPASTSSINYDNLYNQFLTDVNQNTTVNEQRAQQARAQYAEQIRETFKDDDLIPESNKTKLLEIAPPSKDSADYTEEDEKILQQLAATPYVPLESIDINGDKKEGKLSKEFALKINNAIKDYNNATADTSTEFTQWQTNIQKLQELIGDKNITDEDIKMINQILSAPKGKIDNITYPTTDEE